MKQLTHKEHYQNDKSIFTKLELTKKKSCIILRNFVFRERAWVFYF